MGAVRKPRIGELNQRLELQVQVDTGNESGGLDTSYTTVATVSGKISAESGGMIVDGVQDLRVATHRITIRARKKDWNTIKWGDYRFRMISMALDDSGQFAEILCEAIDVV